MVDVRLEPLGQRELSGGAAGDQRDGFGFTSEAFASQQRGLGDQGEAGGFPVEGAGDQSAGDRIPFFQVRPF